MGSPSKHAIHSASENYQCLLLFKDIYIYTYILFGQIIATSHDLGPQKVVFRKGNPRISGKSSWWNIIPFGQMSSDQNPGY